MMKPIAKCCGDGFNAHKACLTEWTKSLCPMQCHSPDNIDAEYWMLIIRVAGQLICWSFR